MQQRSTTIIERSIAGASAGAVLGSVGGVFSAAIGAFIGAVANNGPAIAEAVRRNEHTSSQNPNKNVKRQAR
jgi:hypothetical protein